MLRVNPRTPVSTLPAMCRVCVCTCGPCVLARFPIPFLPPPSFLTTWKKTGRWCRELRRAGWCVDVHAVVESTNRLLAQRLGRSEHLLGHGALLERSKEMCGLLARALCLDCALVAALLVCTGGQFSQRPPQQQEKLKLGFVGNDVNKFRT